MSDSFNIFAPESIFNIFLTGASIGIAAGYHMATGKVPCVYMQNSGFGNAVNPLLSLADPRIYGVPMLLMIGKRRLRAQVEQT